MPFKPGESGNPDGKEPGTKSKKTIAWEILGESISGPQAEKYNTFMNDLWDGEFEQKCKAADYYLQTLEFFKPKLARQNIDVTTGGEPIKAPNIIIPGPETQP